MFPRPEPKDPDELLERAVVLAGFAVWSGMTVLAGRGGDVGGGAGNVLSWRKDLSKLTAESLPGCIGGGIADRSVS